MQAIIILLATTRSHHLLLYENANELLCCHQMLHSSIQCIRDGMQVFTSSCFSCRLIILQSGGMVWWCTMLHISKLSFVTLQTPYYSAVLLLLAAACHRQLAFCHMQAAFRFWCLHDIPCRYMQHFLLIRIMQDTMCCCCCYFCITFRNCLCFYSI